MQVGQRQVQFFGQIQRQRLERTRFAQNGRRARGQHRTAHGDLGDVAQFFERFGKDNACACNHRTHQLVIARHRAGVRRRRFPRRAGLARMQQHHRLARRPRSSRCGEERLRLAELLDDHRNHLRVGLIDHPVDIILHAAGRFVSGRDRIGNPRIARQQHRPQHRRHRARLRDDADGPLARRRDRVGFHKSQGNAVDIVDQAQAIRSFDNHPCVICNTSNFTLLGQALLTALGETGRKDNDSAALACRKASHRFKHSHARDGQHGHIDALGKRIDRGVATLAHDFIALGVHQIDCTSIAIALKVGQQRRAQRAGLVGCADHGHRFRAQESIQGSVRQTRVNSHLHPPIFAMRYNNYRKKDKWPCWSRFTVQGSSGQRLPIEHQFAFAVRKPVEVLFGHLLHPDEVTLALDRASDL